MRSKKNDALLHLSKNENDKARALFEKILEVDNTDPEVWYYLGIVYARLGQTNRAEKVLTEAVQLRPGFGQALYWLGMMHLYQNKPDSAKSTFQRLVDMEPGNAAAWKKLGSIFRISNNEEDALSCYQSALKTTPNDPDIHAELGELFYHQGRFNEALDAYKSALRLDSIHLRAAMGYHLSLPLIYQSHSELLQFRDRYTQGLIELVKHTGSFQQRKNAVNELLWSNGFYLAYQGLNDKDLQVQLARFFESILHTVYPQFSTAVATSDRDNSRIRVGYASHYFREHTVAYYFQEWIAQANREQFEIYVYHLDPKPDAVSRSIASACDHYKELTGSIPGIAETIKADRLDILVYPEIGMYPRHTLLAALRLAPIQCAAWGHPVTTGFDTIDYYLSAETTEPENAQRHYSETLVLLPGMGTSIRTPVVTNTVTRATFGLPEERNLYLCSQSLFKIHPDCDDLLAGIAIRDPNALILFFEDARETVTRTFKHRIHELFAKRGLDPDQQINILPRMGYQQYLELSSLTDLMLDTLYWSGGRTSFDAFACGLPVVTLAGEFSRGRQTYGMLKLLDIPELIASSVDEYIDIAVRIGTEKQYREKLSSIIQQRRSGRLFDNTLPVQKLEEFYQSAVRGR